MSSVRPITPGPHGNPWFSLYSYGGLGRIGRVTMASVVNVSEPGANGPWGITTGPDGNILFAEFLGAAIAAHHLA